MAQIEELQLHAPNVGALSFNEAYTLRKAELLYLRSAKKLRDCTTDEVLAELRDRMKHYDMVVKVVPFDEPTPSVEELIADLRREHGLVVKIVRRVQTESNRLALADRQAARAEAEAAKAAKAKAAKAKAAKTKRGRKATPLAGNGKVVALASGHRKAA